MKIRRRLFECMVRMHPPRFRERFGDQMLAIFDEAEAEGEGAGLLLNAALSAAKQWMSPPRVVAARVCPAATPFAVLDLSHPVDKLLPGACFTLVLFWTVVFAIGNAKPPRRLVGVIESRSGFVRIDRDSMTIAPGNSTRVRTTTLRPDALERMAKNYVRTVIALRVLDEDGDGVIDLYELSRAPRLLQRLDRNRDGQLDAAECGLRDAVAPEFAERAVKAFFAEHPALTVLDTNADGRISNDEMRLATKSLQQLDRNRDGAIGGMEAIPSAIENETALILRVDGNYNGMIDPEEWNSALGQHYREFLEQADENADATVTRTELQRALLGSLDANRDGTIEWKELLAIRLASRR